MCVLTPYEGAVFGDAVRHWAWGAFGGDAVVDEGKAGIDFKVVLIFEKGDDFLREEFAAEEVGSVLNDFRERNLETAGEVEVEVALDDPGDTAFAALGVDADDGLVGTADIFGVEGEVGDCPRIGLGESFFLAHLEAFLDGVLVGSAECALDERTSIGDSRVDWDVVAFFYHINHSVDI